MNKVIAKNKHTVQTDEEISSIQGKIYLPFQGPTLKYQSCLKGYANKSKKIKRDKERKERPLLIHMYVLYTGDPSKLEMEERTEESGLRGRHEKIVTRMGGWDQKDRLNGPAKDETSKLNCTQIRHWIQWQEGISPAFPPQSRMPVA